MSNGEPLVVRGALKPISTLTKPLRSVDTETKQPAQAMRERTDSTVVPAAGRGRRGDGRAGAGRAATARSSAATTSTTSSAAARGVPGADRLAALDATASATPRARLHRLHGGGQVEGRCAPRATPGSRRSTPTTLLERELGMPIAEFFDREGEDEFRAARRSSWTGCSSGADGGAIALGGGSVLSERVREALERHVVVWLDVGAERPGGGSRARAAAGPRSRQLRGAARRARAALRALADAVITGRRRRVRRALPALLALVELPAGPRSLWATSASGDYPVFVGRGLLGDYWPLDGEPLLRHRLQRRAAARRRGSGRERGGS